MGRDVVLAPPTCCCCSCSCCCCCCSLVVPELVGGSRLAGDTEELYDTAGREVPFKAGQLAFAAGALGANLVVSPVAGFLGFYLFLATGGVWGWIAGIALALGILIQASRLGRKHDPEPTAGAVKGLGVGALLCAALAASIAAEIVVGLSILGGLGGDLGILMFSVLWLVAVAAFSLWGWREVRSKT